MQPFSSLAACRSSWRTSSEPVMTPKPGWLFIAGSFELNILYRPLQELFPNRMQLPSSLRTCTCIAGQVLTWDRNSAAICRGQTATPLHHCKRCGNILVCWCCPAPQTGTHLDPVIRWKWRIAGRKGVGLSCCLPWEEHKVWRVHGLRTQASRNLIVFWNRRKNNKSTANKSQPNLTESVTELTIADIVSLRKMVCFSVEECPVPCCTFHVAIPHYPICSQPAAGSSPSSQ